MAEGGKKPDTEGESWESWFGGWMQTAKEKSQSALEFVKKDLTEFGTVIQKETEKAVEITKGSLHSESTTEATKKVKAGLVSFLDNVSKVLVIPHDDDDDIPMKVAADGSGLYDRGKARLHALQLDASTYGDAPHGSPEQYSMWVESFNLDEHKGEISELLVSKVEVRALYTKLVPNEVSNADFWQRYFYRVHQLQCDEARKQALMMRAEQAGGKDSFSWDDDEDDEDNNGEDDDGNHSDWEKMPRPPQSYAAQQQQKKKPSPLASEISSAPHLTRNEEDIQKPKEEDHRPSHSAPEQEPSEGQQAEPSSTDQAHQDKQEKQTEETSMGTGQTAFAAEPSLMIPQPDPVSSDSADASGDSPAWSPLADAPPAANPWSLHIPEDLASASEAAEVDQTGSGESADQTGSGESADHQGTTPSATQSQSSDVVAESFEGSAAGAEGSDVTSSHTGESNDVPADGACGALAESARLDNQPVSPKQENTATEQLSNSDSIPCPTPPQSKEAVPSPPPAATESEPAVEPPPATTAADSDVADTPAADEQHVFEAQPAEQEEARTTGEPANRAVANVDSKEEVKDKTETPAELTNPPDANVEKKEKVELEDKFVPVKDTDVVEEPAKSDDSTQEEGAKAAGSEPAVEGGEEKEIGMKVKGDMVVVGDRDSPSSTESTDISKELGLDEDWEQDFDVEITEEDLKAAEDIAKRLGENMDDNDDDWENWE